jgi:hypothetical protein
LAKSSRSDSDRSTTSSFVSSTIIVPILAEQLFHLFWRELGRGHLTTECIKLVAEVLEL